VLPHPLPDLYCGAPVVVSGTYVGKLPPELTLSGTLPCGGSWSQQVPVCPAGDVPLGKVFVKQRIDDLIARSWLHEDVSLAREALMLSTGSSVPSAVAAMVAFKCSSSKHRRLAEAKRRGGKLEVAKFAVGGAAAVTVVGAVAAGFGDLGASMGNLPVADLAAAAQDALLGGLDGIASGGCCEADPAQCVEGIQFCCTEIGSGCLQCVKILFT